MGRLMPCSCPYAADACDGEHATHYPLQDGGECSISRCRAMCPHEAAVNDWRLNSSDPHSDKGEHHA